MYSTPRILFVMSSIFLLCSMSQAAQCPAEFIKPCECVEDYFPTNVQCSNFTDMVALQSVFDNSLDYPFDHFILRESNIMYLNATWLTTKTIQHITVINTSLVSLFDRTPDPVEMVSVINLYNVTILRGMPWRDFPSLTNLLDLNLENVEVRKLGREFSDNMPKTFRTLKMWRSKTTLLEDEVFRNCTKMRHIEVQYTEVKELKRSMFPNPSKMFEFNFSYNRLETIPSDLFDGMPELSNVYLMGNKLVTIPQSICVGFFYVLENPLICDCKMSWVLSRDCLLYGTCETPSSLKGKSLSQLTTQDFQYCRNSISQLIES